MSPLFLKSVIRKVHLAESGWEISECIINNVLLCWKIFIKSQSAMHFSCWTLIKYSVYNLTQAKQMCFIVGLYFPKSPCLNLSCAFVCLVGRSLCSLPKHGRSPSKGSKAVDGAGRVMLQCLNAVQSSGMCKSRFCICSTVQPWQIYTAKAWVAKAPENVNFLKQFIMCTGAVSKTGDHNCWKWETGCFCNFWFIFTSQFKFGKN